jgi:transcriptional regulator with XRE-family HTH domain
MTKPIIDGLTAKKLRLSLGLTLDQMGEMLGYSPSPHRKAAVHRLETGEREISPIKARLLTAYRSGYRPEDWPEDVNKPKRKRGSYLHNA